MAKSFADHVSALMGSYLLKGFALLDDHCDLCQTPLMRDRQGKRICVACSLRENSNSTDFESAASNTQSKISKIHETPVQNVFADQPDILEREGLMEPETPSTRRVLRDKINWATDILQSNNSVAECIELCTLIRTCAETIKKLDEIKP